MSDTVQSGVIFFGRSEGARLGYSLSPAGDIDGDGFDDLIFGAPLTTRWSADGTAVAPFAGEAILVRGSATGFAPLIRLGETTGDPQFTVFEGSEAYARFGSAVAGGGDIDGDGRDDLLIGSPFRDGSSGADSGNTHIVYGGDSATKDWQNGAPSTGTVSQEIEGGTLRSYGGFAVALVGDVDGDGLSDAAFAAPGASLDTRFGAGAITVMFAGPRDRDFDAPLDGESGVTIWGAAALDYAGAAVSSAGDVNGDGIGDLLIGAPGAAGQAEGSGNAIIVYGRAGGWGGTLDLAAMDPDQGVVLRGAVAADYTGVSVASAGDVNGDGIDDVIVGAPEALGTGVAYIVFGREGGLPASIDLATLDGTTGFRVEGGAGDRMGTSVAGVGDVNGDGIDDILLGAPGTETGFATDAGAALLLLGRSTGFGAVLRPGELAPDDAYIFRGRSAFDNAGITLAGAGDVNGDGVDDLLIGADNADDTGLIDAGAAYLVHGGTAILAGLDGLDGATDGSIDLSRVGAEVPGGMVEAPSTGDGGSAEGSAPPDPDDGAGIEDPVGTPPPDASEDDGSPVAGRDGGSGEAPAGDGGVKADAGAGAPAGLHLRGTAGAETFLGGDGDDWFHGVGGGDRFLSGAGDDIVIGTEGSDIADAGAGNDIVRSLGGGDLIELGDGDDFSLSRDGDDVIRGGAGRDIINTGRGNDFLDGGEGDDILVGGDGADVLVGGAGEDLMRGGEGDDVLAGGADRFVFRRGFDEDRIFDFEVGTDQLDFTAYDGVTSFDDLAVWQVGDHAIVRAVEGSGEDRLALIDIDAALLTADDFTFL